MTFYEFINVTLHTTYSLKKKGREDEKNDRIFNSSKTPVQYGSIQVKENYNSAEELKAITVMYKVYGYNPGAGDWFWVKYSPDGKANPYGKPDGCVGCHGTRANNDFILVHEFR